MLLFYLRFTFLQFKHLETWIYSIPISIFTFYDYECEEYVHMLTDCDIYNFMILLFMIYYSVYSIYLIILYFMVWIQILSSILIWYYPYISSFFSFSAYIQATGDTLLLTLGNTTLVVTFHHYTMFHWGRQMFI